MSIDDLPISIDAITDEFSPPISHTVGTSHEAAMDQQQYTIHKQELTQ